MNARRSTAAGSPFVARANHFPREATPPEPPRRDWTGAATLLATCLLQAGVGIWWGSKLDNRVDTLERRFAAFEQLPAQISRLDQKTDDEAALLKTVIDRMDRRGR